MLVVDIKNISIRGRMAYLICLFEKLLVYYNCDKGEWRRLLEKLWAYTNIRYLDDWMYELAEYMPNSILEDTIDDVEYITKKEFEYLYKLYSKSEQEILVFLNIIYECGTCELYSKLYNHSPDTLKWLDQAIDILNKNNIDLVDIKPFEKYLFSECDGWGNCFEDKQLSKFI